MIVDASIHNYNLKKSEPIFNLIPQTIAQEQNRKDKDYTAYLMCTLREYKDGKFVNKNREWNNPAKLMKWRSVWVGLLNSAINSSDCKVEDKENWEKKLSIYPELYAQEKSQIKSKV